jgi:hypothetical protein
MLHGTTRIGMTASTASFFRKYTKMKIFGCPAAEEGGNDDLDDDDCPSAIPVESAGAAAVPELDREENLCLCVDVGLSAGDEGQDASVASCTSPMSWLPTTPMSWPSWKPTSPVASLTPTPIAAIAVATVTTDPLHPCSVAPVVSSSRVNRGYVRRATFLSLGTTLIGMTVPTASFFMTLPDGRSVRRSARLNPDNAPDSFELTRLQDGRVVRRSTRIAQRLRRTGGV